MADHRRIKDIVFFCLCAIILSLLISYRLLGEKVQSPYAEQKKIYFYHTNQELTVHFSSGREKGPTLLIFGGIHGDERAAFLAADRFTRIQTKNGRLILVPRLNAVAIDKRNRLGLGGDMNRLFDLPHKTSQHNPDTKVVELAKSLINDADIVINLHQAYDFYAHSWVSKHRNPSKWGQSNVIDTPIYHLHNGDKIEPGRFAHRVARRSNTRIHNSNYQFLVNNTETGGKKSRHKEQRGSLTYYALTKAHKIALAIEATKNCSLPEAIRFLTIAVNSALEEAGMRSDNLPSEDVNMISAEMKETFSLSPS